jgi:hypothetical protein
LQLWTYHPADFRLDDPCVQRIDPARGMNWNEPTLRYRESLHALCRALNISQFPLWCCTVRRGVLADHVNPPLEWELNVPDSDSLAFLFEPAWDAALRGNGEWNWDSVLIPHRPVVPDENVSAIVCFPLAPGWLLACHGRQVRPEWRSEVAQMKHWARRAQEWQIQRYRAIAAGCTSSTIARELSEQRAQYLEEQLGLRD